MTYTIVQLWNSTIRDWQARLEHQIDKGVDVTLFREVQRQRTVSIIASEFKILHHVPQQR